MHRKTAEDDLVEDVERKLLGLRQGTMVYMKIDWTTLDQSAVIRAGCRGHVHQDPRAGRDNYVEVCWHGFSGCTFMTPREVFEVLHEVFARTQ